MNRNDGKMNKNGRRCVFCIKAAMERRQGREDTSASVLRDVMSMLDKQKEKCIFSGDYCNRMFMARRQWFWRRLINGKETSDRCLYKLNENTLLH